MRQIDGITINKIGIPGNVLMEQAGYQCYKQISKILKKFKYKNIFIFCGKGNNGGDGFVIARYLIFEGFRPILVLTDNESNLKGDSLINFLILKNLQYDNFRPFSQKLNLNDSLIIDAILGTGIKGELSDDLKKIINKINRSDNYVISIDTPSGLSEVYYGNIPVKADITLTIGFYKTLFFNKTGREFTGKLEVVPLHFPENVLQSIESKIFKNFVELNKLNSNNLNLHKGNNGKALIIAGSYKYPGACILTARAMIEMGVGLTYVLCPQKICNIVKQNCFEAIVEPLTNDENGKIEYSERNKNTIIEYLKKVDAVVIGPGLGVSDDLKRLIIEIIKFSKKNIVIDADALNNISLNFNSVLNLNSKISIIATPHPGEFSRMCGNSVFDIENKRLDSSIRFTSENAKNFVLVLKGKNTIITNSKTTFINFSGNELLAVGGSGDVLSGIIGSFLSKSEKPITAAKKGVYFHGAIADFLKKKNIFAIKAGDLIKNIKNTFNYLIK
jgi:NAD(P)H-hydrate epimerase